jgi:hypothetical protein
VGKCGLCNFKKSKANHIHHSIASPLGFRCELRLASSTKVPSYTCGNCSPVPQGNARWGSVGAATSKTGSC